MPHQGSPSSPPYLGIVPTYSEFSKFEISTFELLSLDLLSSEFLPSGLPPCTIFEARVARAREWLCSFGLPPVFRLSLKWI